MACRAATVTNRDKKSSKVRRLLTQTGGWMDGWMDVDVHAPLQLKSLSMTSWRKEKKRKNPLKTEPRARLTFPPENNLAAGESEFSSSLGNSHNTVNIPF